MFTVPKSLYVHVPFCRHRCGYCNFSVVAGKDHLQDEFLRCLELELANIDPSVKRTPLSSVFLGGGTPTQLRGGRLLRLGAILRDHFRFDQDVEYTAEANPEDIDAATLEQLMTIGVNRLSLGIQSFNLDKTRTLERSHDQRKAIQAIELAAQTIRNVSIDLIFAVPGETPAVWLDDLKVAVALPITHASTYCLTFEKGTRFWSRRRSGKLENIDEEFEAAMYDQSRHTLASHGFEHYEISNFARAGFDSRHNRAYWDGLSWHGIGPGAASFVDGVRRVNHRSTTTYLKRIGTGECAVAETETLTQESFARELAAFGIRQLRGVDLADIAERTGFDLAVALQDPIERLVEQGIIQRDANRIRLTHAGVLYADVVARYCLGFEGD